MEFILNNITYKNTNTRLGSGAFGKVDLYIGGDRSKIAVKQQLTKAEKQKRSVANEFGIQNELSMLAENQHIIKILGQKTEGDETYFALEYANGGTIHEKTIKTRAHPRMVKYYFQMLIAGVSFLHKNGIVHLDIKTRNLILGDRGILKIADFGKATRYIINGRECYVDGVIGTRKYAAPELGKQMDVKATPVDIFSCGITLLHMAANSNESWDYCGDMMHRRWENGETDYYDIWRTVDTPVLTLIRDMTRSDVTKRATIEQIKDNEWFKEGSHQLRVAPQKKKVFEFGNDTRQIKKRTLGSTTDLITSKKSKQ